MVKRIMFVGAGFLQSFAIKKAKELGYYVIAVDRDNSAAGFKYCDAAFPIDIINLTECLRCAKQYKIDGILSVASELGSVTASLIASELGLRGTKPEVLATTRDKFLTASVLQLEGIEQFDTLAKVGKDVDISTMTLQYPVIVKPIDGSGSKAVSKVSNRVELQKAVEIAIDASGVGEAIIQDFFEGHEFGVECFCYQGTLRVMVVLDKYMTPAPIFSELGHMCPVLPNEAPLDRIGQVVRNTLCALDIESGSINIDLIVDSHERVHIVDLSPRMGGNLIGSHIIPMSTGIDLNKAAIQWALGETPNLEPLYQKVIVTRLLDMIPGRLLNISDYGHLYEDRNVLDICLTASPGKIVRTYRTNHDSCGYLVVTGDTKENARVKVEQIKADLQDCFVMEAVEHDTF